VQRIVEESAPERLWTRDPRVRGIVANVADAVVVIDTTGRIELVNPAAERLFGYRAEEILGQDVAVLAPPEYRQRHACGLARYLETGEAHIIGKGREVEGLRKDGTTFPMYISVGESMLPGFHGFIGVLHDLSAQKAAERDLAQARGYLQDIIDSMPSMLVGLDASARITHWNRVAAGVCRIPAEQAVGQPFERLFPFLEAEMEGVSQAILAGQPFKRERLPYPAGGDTRYADVVVYPLAGQATPGAVVRIDDVTERMRMEETMVQTEKMMSVGGLAAGMAHEINNPLGVMSQGCQNLLRRVSDEIPANREAAESLGVELSTVRAYLERRGFFRFLAGMQEATVRASRIVSDMLAYSRRSASSFVQVRLAELLEEVLRLASHDYDLKTSYDFRRIRIVRDFGPGSDEVCCDRTAIEQVVLNLLRNAAQAMSMAPMDRVPEIRLRLRDEGERVRLEVEDNGPGMTEEVRRRLFEPFFTTKPVGVGTGLGLSVAYFIVTEQHRGSMEAVSAPREGARFVVRLPRRGRPYAAGGAGEGSDGGRQP
jgi:PAS domain S-box-containing protein